LKGEADVYGHADKRDQWMTLDEARRIASNIAKLSKLLGKGSNSGVGVGFFRQAPQSGSERLAQRCRIEVRC
jgi:hypothetical protein